MSTPQTFSQLIDVFVRYINTGTGLLITAAIVIYFYGISTRLFKEKHGSVGEWGPYLLWGVIIIFFMVSIIGLVDIVQNSIFGGNL